MRRLIVLLVFLAGAFSVRCVWGQAESFAPPATRAPAGIFLAPAGPLEDGYAPPPILPPGPVLLLDPVTGGPLPPNAFVPYDPTGTGVGSQLHSTVGFDYIHPFWSNRSFIISVPSGPGGLVPLLGDARDVTNNFGLAPRVDFTYQLLGPLLGVQAAGSLVQLSGNLNRTITSSAGTGTLNARDTLALAFANVGELTTTLLFKNWDCACVQNSHLKDALLTVSLGPRYSSIQQTFDATLSSGVNNATLHSDQSFYGFGLTSSAYFLWPLSPSFRIYNNFRTSILVGDNTRRASNFVVAPDNPSSSTSTTFQEVKTTLLPVEQFEVGLDLGRPVSSWSYAGGPAALVWLRAGFTAQIWGDAGMFAPANSPTFHNSTLYLLGFSLMVGFQR